ncbi:MAG TPA: hypothetical protein PLQ61_06775 [Bacteroidales bacterium]|nr:hypothetical protein [Petrotogaceae bacterium]HQJ20880.1 hypothetical protein [Bacteroidales bacterium]
MTEQEMIDKIAQCLCGEEYKHRVNEFIEMAEGILFFELEENLTIKDIIEFYYYKTSQESNDE